MAHPFISEIRSGDYVQASFLVTKKSLRLTKGGAPYLALTLRDRSGEIEGRVWDEAEHYDGLFEPGSYLNVSAQASEYGKRVQLKIDRLKPLDPATLDPADYLVSTRFSIEQMWQELEAMIEGVGDPFIHRILRDFLDDPLVSTRLRQAPAAKGVHHAFVGGLLEHTLSVIQLAHRIADHYPRVNRDLMVAGAFLHDLGKVQELSWDGGVFDYTTEGRLVGHLLITIQWIREKASQIPNFPKELEIHLSHLVAAHHGQLEYGSPKEPQTLEAMLVHALDELDSRVQSWTSIMESDQGDEWTGFQQIYRRFLYKGPGWGAERLGLGERPEGKPWRGESLYRREALGELSAGAEAGEKAGEGTGKAGSEPMFSPAPKPASAIDEVPPAPVDERRTRARAKSKSALASGSERKEEAVGAPQELKPEAIKTETILEAKSKAKSEVTSEVKPEHRSEGKSEGTSERKSERKSEQKSERKSDGQSEAQSEPAGRMLDLFPLSRS